MTTQETIALAATIRDEAKRLENHYRDEGSTPARHAYELAAHNTRCHTLYLKLCEQAPGEALPDARVIAAALKVTEALGETDVTKIRVPGVLALALLNLERVVKRASSEELKQSLKDVERHPVGPDDTRTYAQRVLDSTRVGHLPGMHATVTFQRPTVTAQALQILDKLCGEPALASPEALAGLRELVYAVTKEQAFADTLAKKCDELAAENKRLESENHNLKGQLVHMQVELDVSRS